MSYFSNTARILSVTAALALAGSPMALAQDDMSDDVAVQSDLTEDDDVDDLPNEPNQMLAEEPVERASGDDPRDEQAGEEINEELSTAEDPTTAE